MLQCQQTNLKSLFWLKSAAIPSLPWMFLIETRTSRNDSWWGTSHLLWAVRQWLDARSALQTMVHIPLSCVPLSNHFYSSLMATYTLQSHIPENGCRRGHCRILSAATTAARQWCVCILKGSVETWVLALLCPKSRQSLKSAQLYAGLSQSLGTGYDHCKCHVMLSCCGSLPCWYISSHVTTWHKQ